VDDRTRRVAKALAEAHFISILLGPGTTEGVLASEVRMLHGAVDRVRVLIKSWREVATERRSCAADWREQGESFAWHAIRADCAADILETQALILESIFNPENLGQ
jgi:hypothetical protein